MYPNSLHPVQGHLSFNPLLHWPQIHWTLQIAFDQLLHWRIHQNLLQNGASVGDGEQCHRKLKNKFCNQRSCFSLTRRFSKLRLDAEYLQLSIKNTGDLRNDFGDKSNRLFRKTVNRHFIIDKYGYLGKNKKKVCPSCVLKIRQHFPSATGAYMGFRCN